MTNERIRINTTILAAATLALCHIGGSSCRHNVVVSAFNCNSSASRTSAFLINSQIRQIRKFPDSKAPFTTASTTIDESSLSNANRRSLMRRSVSSEVDVDTEKKTKGATKKKEKIGTIDVVPTTEEEEEDLNHHEEKQEKGPLSTIADTLSEKIGKVDEDRVAFPELVSGEVDRVFSNLSYKKETTKDGMSITSAMHESGSTTGAALLIAGTTIGAGILALPTATAPAGFLPSSAGLFIAWLYMCISGLLIAELSINRIGETGKPGLGLLELFNSSLGKPWDKIAGLSYFFLHYTVMVAYLAQGGNNIDTFLESVNIDVSSVPAAGQFILAGASGSLVYFSKPTTVEKVNNALVFAVIATFGGILTFGAGSADFGSLLALENQHPDLVVDAFPILFLSMVYHNIVPTVVTQLEADSEKIKKAILGGTLIPFVMFLAWNAVILGNIATVYPDGLDNIAMDPIALLQNEGIGGETLSSLVSVFSELAITTSLIGFIYGLLDGWTDVFKLPSKGPEFDQWKPALFAAVMLPPLWFSFGNPDIFFTALDYGGAFGVSTLFLVFPPIMVWKARYGDDKRIVTVPPMVPFGKIPLGSLWKAAGTLIIEQGADKLGVFDYLKDHVSFFAE